jgi:hypothetical protein
VRCREPRHRPPAPRAGAPFSCAIWFDTLPKKAPWRALHGSTAMPAREEVIISAVPLSLRVERGAGTGELRVVVEGFDPIELAPHFALF